MVLLSVVAAAVVQIELVVLPVLLVHFVAVVVLSVVAVVLMVAVLVAGFASLEAIGAAKPNFVILED